MKYDRCERILFSCVAVERFQYTMAKWHAEILNVVYLASCHVFGRIICEHHNYSKISYFFSVALLQTDGFLEKIQLDF